MTSRPVRFVLTREEVFQMCANRHPIYVHIETAHAKDGTLLAKRARHILDGGSYGGTGVAACAQSTIWACLPYKMNSVDVEARRVYTNNPHCGAMRGYTSCQIHFCHDLHMQYASEQMKIDPVDFFDTFRGYEPRDTAKEQEYNLSNAKPGQFALTPKEAENIEQKLLDRMSYSENVIIKKGWFPESAFDLESEKYAVVHIDTGLYSPTYSGWQYFFPRMSKGGVIIVSGYENGKSLSVRRTIDDLEAKYGAFLITPLGDPEGTVVITCP